MSQRGWVLFFVACVAVSATRDLNDSSMWLLIGAINGGSLMSLYICGQKDAQRNGRQR